MIKTPKKPSRSSLEPLVGLGEAFQAEEHDYSPVIDPILRDFISMSPHLSQIQQLELTNKGIRNVDLLEREAYRLKRLNLSHNRIQSLSFAPPRLAWLDLSYNEISCVSTFRMDFLTVLNLSHNKLTDIRPLLTLPMLTQLNINYNSLTNLQGIEHLENLTALFADHNCLQELDLKNRHLLLLSATDNYITRAQLDCPHLERVYLCNNSLSQLNVGPQVKVLSTRNNRSHLDYSSLKALETLHVSGNLGAVLEKNRLRVLHWDCSGPFDARCMRDMQVAIFSGPFDIAPLSFSHYPIQHLELIDVGLSMLPSWLAQRFPCLSVLNLAYNRIDEHSLATISELQHLRSIGLYENNISHLNAVAETVRNLPFLGCIDLRNNPVTANYYTPVETTSRCPNAYEQYMHVLSQSTTPTDDPNYVQYFRLMKGLGIWWLDGAQISISNEYNIWIGKYGFATIFSDNSCDLPSPHSYGYATQGSHSQALVQNNQSAESVADMLLDYFHSEFEQLNGYYH